MERSTEEIYIVLWDQSGFGHDTVLGAFWDEFVALDEIDTIIKKFGKRYVRSDFILYKKEVN